MSEVERRFKSFRESTNPMITAAARAPNPPSFPLAAIRDSTFHPCVTERYLEVLRLFCLFFLPSLHSSFFTTFLFDSSRTMSGARHW